MDTMIYDDLIKTLKERFEKNMHRHIGIDWNLVQEKLLASPAGKHFIPEKKISQPEAP